MRNLFALLSGALGGAGLVVSGMTDTAKIQGWLDFAGSWNPTLGFVLTGALIPMVVAWRIANARAASVLGQTIPRHPHQKIEPTLIVGSTIFGVGWGLAGLCPGPAIASVAFGGTGGLVFLAAMIVGMAVAPRLILRFERGQQIKP
jgi:uncharacterized protein